MKKELQRKLSFVLFVMAVFFAGMALTVFSDYIWMACIAGVLLLAASVFFAFSPKEEAPSATEKTTELLMADRMAELMRGNEKAEKGVYIAVKKQHEAMESGMAALKEQITELVKAQETAVKTLVMYNKENAKQMALSEREELGRLREELKRMQAEPGNSGSMDNVVDAIREMSHRLYEEIHENGEAVLSELGTTVDALEEIKEEIKDLNTGVPVVIDRSSVPKEESIEEPMESLAYFSEESEEAEEPADELYSDEPEEKEYEERSLSEEPVVDEPSMEMFAESGVDLSDPNKPLSADDIAALFAQANAATEEEEPAEEEPEDALASSGVDLSDPNKTLSADDIAALFAAMGN
ncbi:MAG: hypothetical protein IKT67_03910 [Lachnospiraceae bacterium]|nr:hypothetical protein [Lachnospiraceae bacterium]